MSNQQLYLQSLPQTTGSASTASVASDSSYILQTKSVSVTQRPRLEHLKYYVLGKLRPFQIPLLAALILLSLAIILRKIRRRK